MEWLKPSEGPTLRSWVRHMFISARTLLASTLPSSTPHWSKLLMPQMKPCTALQGFARHCRGSYTSTPQSYSMDSPMLTGLSAQMMPSEVS